MPRSDEFLRRMGAIPASEKGAPLGVAALDGTGKIAPSALPDDSVESVNGQTGVVVLDAADVGADPAGTGASEAAAAVTAHEAATDPHPVYLTAAEGDAAYAPLSHTHALSEGASVVKTADTSRTSTTTRTADPHLSVPVTANRRYRVEVFLEWGAGAGGISVEFSGPAGAVLAVGNVGGSLTAVLAGLGAGFPLGASQSGRGAYVGGKLRTGGTAGSLTLLWAQTSSNAAASTLHADSHIVLTDLGPA